MDEAYAALVALLSNAFSSLTSQVNYLLATFAVIAIVILGLTMALGDGTTGAPKALRSVFLISFIGFMALGWPTIATSIVSTLSALGLAAGGSNLTASQVHDPNVVAGIGTKIMAGFTWPSLSWNPLVLLSAACDYIFMKCFQLYISLVWYQIAIRLAVILIETQIVLIISYILIPFGMLTRTAFIAEGAMASAFSVGAQLFATNLIMSGAIATGKAVTGAIPAGTLPSFITLYTIVAVSLFFKQLLDRVPDRLARLIGSPSLKV